MNIANCRELYEASEEALEALEHISQRCFDINVDAALENIHEEVESVLPVLKAAIGKFDGSDD